LGGNCGEQFCGFAAALTNSCFEKRQLWGAILENNFGKQLLETTFGGNFSNLGMSPIATPATKRKFM
jgi:hypothetical protein